jgi:hypothetical protein
MIPEEVFSKVLVITLATIVGYILATYPTISAMLQIFATLHVTTATGGKSFSALQYLKNYLRSTMIEDRRMVLPICTLIRTLNWHMARSLKSLKRITDA